MKTKSLLIAAATLAVGVIASQAAVYSQNIVGYYNVAVGGNQFGLVANQMNLDNTNGISDIFTGGLVSDVDGNNNSVIWLWNPLTGQYTTYQYFSAADAGTDFSSSVAGWYSGDGARHNNPLPPGSGCFIQNFNNANPINVTVVGNVPQGTNLITMNQGYSLVSSPVPISTNICSGAGFVGYSDVDGNNNDVVWLWNPVTQQYTTYQYFSAADANTDFSQNVAGFYSGDGAIHNVAPNVGTGFFIQHLVPGTITWTNTLTVQ